MLQRLRLRLKRFWRTLHWRHPHAVPFITIGALIVVSGVGFLVAVTTDKLPEVHDAKIVIISYDHQQQIVPSKKQTVGTLLRKLHIKLNQGDVVEPAARTVINQDQFRINIYRAVPVQIVDGSKHTFALSAAKTPRAVAQQTGANLYPEDSVATDPAQDFIRTGALGTQVTVNRATAINVDLYGTPVVLRTHAKTVGELIKEKGIKLIKDDKVVPAPDTPLTPGQPVSFIRTGTKTETVTEEIAMQVQTINDPSLAYGTKAIRQQGSPGQQVVTYQIALTNNVETSRTVIQKVINKAPVTQIEVRGTNLSGIKGDMALAGIAPNDYSYVDYIFTRESHWNPAARSSNGYVGLGQTSLSNLSGACPDWQNDPICQMRYFSRYASRYGGWGGAYNFWIANGWW